MAALKKDNVKLEQAFAELIQAFISLEEQLEKKHSDDDEAYSSAMVETIESVLDSALEEGDVTTANIAQMLAVFTEALEEIDPNAFEDIVDDDDDDDDDYDLDDEELEEYNEDDDDDDE